MRLVFSGSQWFSLVLIDYHPVIVLVVFMQLSTVLSGSQWFSVVLNCFQCFSLVLSCYK